MPETSLLPVIRQLILQHGSISIAQYMALCLGHPQYGYYMSREPFGAQGDFITAPEISQLFGEMIGIWVMTAWQQLGSPKPVQLVELGPGRGTLMHDIWRSLSVMPGLREKLAIHLVELSPRLQKIQRDMLQGIPVHWHESIDTIPQQPSIIIANEFFDALSINQALYHNGHWHERVIISDEDDLLFGIGKRLQGVFADAKDGAIFEYAPLASDIMGKIALLIRKNSGACLAIDYGDDVALNRRIGETLQALYQKKPGSVLDHPGEADITAHVAFAALKQVVNEMDLAASIQTQREFLTQHGIRLRAEKLLAKADAHQAKALQSGLDRLIAPDQMGDLFKVLQVTSL